MINISHSNDRNTVKHQLVQLQVDYLITAQLVRFGMPAPIVVGRLPDYSCRKSIIM